MKTRLSLMLALAGMIIAGAMLVGVVSADDPEVDKETEQLTAVTLYCNPECKVIPPVDHQEEYEELLSDVAKVLQCAHDHEMTNHPTLTVRYTAMGGCFLAWRHSIRDTMWRLGAW